MANSAAIGWFKGTQLAGGTSTNLNSAASWTALKMNTSQELDSNYYSYDGGSQPTRIVIEQAGDYLISVGLPMSSNSSNTSNRNDIEMEIRKNGTLIPGGWSDSSYIRNSSGHNESSNRATVFVTCAVDDYIEVYVQRGSTETTNTITNGGHSVYLEYIEDATVYAARGTQTTNSTNLNQSTEYAMQWSTDDRKDSGFTHSTSTNSHNITLDAAAKYLVFADIPLDGAVTRGNITARVKLDGTLVDGGIFQQGMVRNTDGITSGSCHWAGLVESTSTNQVLTITTQQEAAAGTLTVGSYNANVIVIKLPSTDGVYQAEATTMDGGGTNWNPTTKVGIDWSTDNIIDTAKYTHSTSTNQHQITVDEAGDYFIAINAAFSGAVTRANPKMTVQVNSSDVGLEAKSGYCRNTSSADSSSDVIVGFLPGLSANDIITVSMEAEAATGTINDDTPGVIFIWKKEPLTSGELKVDEFVASFEAGDTVVPVGVQTASFALQAASISGDSLFEAAVKTVTATIATATLSIGSLISPSTQVASFTTQAPTLTLNSNIAATTQEATFSLPAATVSGDSSFAATTQEATFSLQTPTISGAALDTPAVKSMIFTVPAVTLEFDYTQAVGVQSATFTTQSPTVSVNVLQSAGVQTATFSSPGATAFVGAFNQPGVQSLTFSVPAHSVSLPHTEAVGVQTASFTTQSVTTQQGATEQPAAQLLTVTTPTMSVSTEVVVASSIQAATFNTDAPTIVADHIFSVNEVTATFSQPAATQSVGVLQTTFPQASTFSVQSVSIVTTVVCSPSAQSATFTHPAATLSVEVNQAAGVQDVTLTIPAVTVSGDANFAPAVKTMIVGIQEITISTQQILSADVQSATFSTQAIQVNTDQVMLPDVQVATFTIPAFTTSIEVVFPAPYQSAIFSQPAATPSTEVVQSAGVQTLTFTIPGETLSVSVTETPGAQSVTITLLAPNVIADSDPAKRTVVTVTVDDVRGISATVDDYRTQAGTVDDRGVQTNTVDDKQTAAKEVDDMTGISAIV